MNSLFFIIDEEQTEVLKACIFDLDGTLVDSLESIHYSVNATLEELGLKQITKEQCQAFVGNGARYLMERSLEAAGDSELKYLEKAMEIYMRIFEMGCVYHVKPYKGVRELLMKLKEKGVRLAVLSNKPHMQTLQVVCSVFGKDIFDYVQGQCEEIPRKPDPMAVYIIADKLGIAKEDILYIGDSETDMQTGHAAGLKTVGVSWGFRSREALKMSGADSVVDRAEEIYHLYFA